MNPAHFLIRYPRFCGITRTSDAWDDPDFYIRRNKDEFPQDLEDPNEHYFEFFSEFEFKNGSAIRNDMKAVKKWMMKNLFDEDLHPIGDTEGWYWGEVPYTDGYNKVG
jgi:hypothetical protein